MSVSIHNATDSAAPESAALVADLVAARDALRKTLYQRAATGDPQAIADAAVARAAEQRAQRRLRDRLAEDEARLERIRAQARRDVLISIAMLAVLVASLAALATLAVLA